MCRATVIFACLLTVAPGIVFAQDGTGSGQSSSAASSTAQSKSATTDPPPGPKFVRTLTNVQVELTLTDYVGTQEPAKKTVSMIVSSGNWGKIRNTAARVGPNQIGLNVDARPFVTSDGVIQLELTLYYYPPQGKPDAPVLPTELNQSLTVALQSGKPMMVSQAADPASDRKVTVEVKATVLK